MLFQLIETLKIIRINLLSSLRAILIQQILGKKENLFESSTKEEHRTVHRKSRRITKHPVHAAIIISLRDNAGRIYNDGSRLERSH